MTNQWPSDTTIVIPAFRAADLLLQLLPRVRKSVPRENIVVVDDASGDSTPQLCSDLGVSCLRHHVNRGKGSALLTGFHHCITGGSRWIISMDADGQHSPDDLPKFIAASLQQPAPGICIGARSMRPGIMPFERILSNRLTSGILGILAGIPIVDSQCGYRLYSTRLLEAIDIEYRRFEMESEIILKAAFIGFPVTFTGIQTLYLKGPSHISHVADTIRWITAVLRIRSQRQRIIRHYRQKSTDKAAT